MSQLQPSKQDKDYLRNLYMKSAISQFENKVPIYRGCPNKGNGGCFCPGTCREIIGYRDKIPGEN